MMRFRDPVWHFKAEVVLLLTITVFSLGLLKIFPGGVIGGIDRSTFVGIYYGLSLAVIIGLEAAWLIPLSKLKVVNGGLLLLLVVIAIAALFLWLSRRTGGLLDFSSLEEGHMLGAIVFALVFPTVQLVAKIAAYGRNDA